MYCCLTSISVNSNMITAIIWLQKMSWKKKWFFHKKNTKIMDEYDARSPWERLKYTEKKPMDCLFGNGVKPQCVTCLKKIVKRDIFFHCYPTANIFVIFFNTYFIVSTRIISIKWPEYFFASSFVMYIFLHLLYRHFFRQRYGCNNYYCYECLKKKSGKI